MCCQRRGFPASCTARRIAVSAQQLSTILHVAVMMAVVATIQRIPSCPEPVYIPHLVMQSTHSPQALAQLDGHWRGVNRTTTMTWQRPELVLVDVVTYGLPHKLTHQDLDHCHVMSIASLFSSALYPPVNETVRDVTIAKTTSCHVDTGLTVPLHEKIT